MNAALGTRFVPDFFLAVLRDAFLDAALFVPADFFFAELFFFAVAIASPGD
jgi:hypothetical protein